MCGPSKIRQLESASEDSHLRGAIVVPNEAPDTRHNEHPTIKKIDKRVGGLSYISNEKTVKFKPYSLVFSSEPRAVRRPAHDNSLLMSKLCVNRRIPHSHRSQEL